MVRSAITRLLRLPTGRAAVVLTMFVVVSASLAQEPEPRVEFVTPNFSKVLFDIDSVFLEPGELRVVTNALTALAANFPADSRITPGLRAKALAISLRLDGTHRDSVLTMQKLKQGETPLPVPGFEDPDDATLELWQLAEALDRADASRDDHVLACYLMDIAMLIDPERPGGSARFKELSRKGKFLGWNDVVTAGKPPPENFPAAVKPAGSAPKLPAEKGKVTTNNKPAAGDRAQGPEGSKPASAVQTPKPE